MEATVVRSRPAIAVALAVFLIVVSCSTTTNAPDSKTIPSEDSTSVEKPRKSPWRWLLYGAITGTVIVGVIIAVVLLNDNDGFLEDADFSGGDSEDNGGGDGVLGL